ncbi:hypothetical protein AA23498_2664 [Acetobacter nitrogenifigens DSM 23921 = NBRC 105050]|uniref:Uncharacterized protein n=1 Tax=Acetobacter nitrogenifigens DSM 23921 = NBRC 105050 TaxID=1120919 RepID=A0A511XFM9_9PROT|nr:hypothetical protein AA23498_2664 [Acetobacter nitrogenifigens DSM 23921 = NBRC 105050]GEN61766.1 hypothetical protein ANI02nite_36500 [Acetobacter nitrogenifigens DSM 23921 = NBRC 105050]
MGMSLFITTVLGFIPPNYAATGVAFVSFAVASCALVMRFWKPPSSDSRWVVVYKVVSALAQARGWNACAYQPDRKALMIPVSTSRSDAADTLGLKSDNTRP